MDSLSIAIARDRMVHPVAETQLSEHKTDI